MNTTNAAVVAEVEERRMDCELTVSEIEKLYILAIRERARSHDKPADVNLARKLAEYRRRANS